MKQPRTPAQNQLQHLNVIDRQTTAGATLPVYAVDIISYRVHMSAGLY